MADISRWVWVALPDVLSALSLDHSKDASQLPVWGQRCTCAKRAHVFQAGHVEEAARSGYAIMHMQQVGFTVVTCDVCSVSLVQGMIKACALFLDSGICVWLSLGQNGSWTMA